MMSSKSPTSTLIQSNMCTGWLFVSTGRGEWLFNRLMKTTRRLISFQCPPSWIMTYPAFCHAVLDWRRNLSTRSSWLRKKPGQSCENPLLGARAFATVQLRLSIFFLQVSRKRVLHSHASRQADPGRHHPRQHQCLPDSEVPPQPHRGKRNRHNLIILSHALFVVTMAEPRSHDPEFPSLPTRCLNHTSGPSMRSQSETISC